MRLAATIALTVVLAVSVAGAQSELPDREFLSQANSQVEHYAETFHDLTARETMTIVSNDAFGRPAPTRTVVSSLIIYRSQADAKFWVEYRDVESVDGKEVKDHEKRAIKLLEKVTDAKSAADELDRITKEGNRFNHNVSTTNLTLHQGVPLVTGCLHAFRFYSLGHETIRQIPTRVYRYEQTAPCGTFHYKLGLLREYEEGPRTHKGTLWLDSATSQIVREQRDIYVESTQHAGIKVKVVEMVFDYRPSSFGILVPSSISIKSSRVVNTREGTPALVPQVHLTQSYGPFSRFEVSVEQKVVEPK